MRNVSRAWAYETGLAAGVELGSGMQRALFPSFKLIDFVKDIPVNEYYEYFGPDHKLDVRPSNMEDLNTREYLDRVKSIVMENLRHLGGPPSVQMMGTFPLLTRRFNFNYWMIDIPQLPIDLTLEDPNQDEDMEDPDVRRPQRLLDSLIQNDGELSDSDDEGEGGRRNHARHRDRDSVTSGVGRRFGVGVGIMGAALPGTANSGGSGGPSMHTTVPPIVIENSRIGTPGNSDNMDIDDETIPSANDDLNKMTESETVVMTNGVNGHTEDVVLDETPSVAIADPTSLISP